MLEIGTGKTCEPMFETPNRALSRGALGMSFGFLSIHLNTRKWQQKKNEVRPSRGAPSGWFEELLAKKMLNILQLRLTRSSVRDLLRNSQPPTRIHRLVKGSLRFFRLVGEY